MAQPPRSLYPGDVVDQRFRIDDALARGGYGMVYAGHDLENNSPVVIKILQPEKALDEKTAIRFKRESRVTASLTHPNLVHIIHYGADEKGLLYLVMESIEGFDLVSVVERDGALLPERVEHILVQILRALAAAHNKNIIHRDLKPENILLVDDGSRDTVKIIDFGIAKLLGDFNGGSTTMDAQLTADGVLLGTPGYLAPEVIQGEDYSISSDLYCAGIVAYELLVGQPAFTGTFIQKVRKQANEEPPLPADDLQRTNVWSVIHKLISPDPATRYVNARDALADLGYGEQPDPSEEAHTATRPPLALILAVFAAIVILALILGLAL